MANGLSIKLPLAYDHEDGPYKLTKTLKETVKQNFKHLVMTSPGEKIMNPDFGVGLRNFLFENQDQGVVENFKERLYVQAEKYMPFVSIINVNTSFFENTFNVDIKYFIKPIAIEDALSLNVISK